MMGEGRWEKGDEMGQGTYCSMAAFGSEEEEERR